MAAKWLGRIGSAESPTIAIRRFSCRMRNRSHAPLEARTVASGRGGGVEGGVALFWVGGEEVISRFLFHRDCDRLQPALLLPPSSPSPPLREAPPLSAANPPRLPVATPDPDPSRYRRRLPGQPRCAPGPA